MEDPDVLAKQAVVEWCRLATAHSASINGGKPWSYGLIPHNAIMENQTLASLLDRFVVSSPAELA
jgi:type III restriction enzyme